MMHRRLIVHVCSLLMAAGCATTQPSPRPAGESGVEPVRAAPGQFKSLTVVADTAVQGFGPWHLGRGGGDTTFWELHSAGLASGDLSGTLDGKLARLPSIEDGSIALLPDGRMQTTWRLRPDVRWHDGRPFTADDIVLSWRIYRDPDLPVGGGLEHINTMERVEALDPLQVVITWKTTFFQHLYLGVRELWPYPYHLLGDAFLGDKEAFMRHPYFTTEYVHLGPFKLVDFGMGLQLVLERFDDYFLGRPKLDRVIIRIINDANTALAVLLSGEADMITEGTLTPDLFADLRDQWARTGAGIVLSRRGNWRYLMVQFNREHARPIEFATDVRLRAGLYYGFDQEAIREISAPGFADTDAASFMLLGDPRGATVGQPFARYRYDPARAIQELANAGWRRGPDGRMMNAGGEQVKLDVQIDSVEPKGGAVVADNWRRLGFDVSETLLTAALSRNQERDYQRTFPTVYHTGRSTGDKMFVGFDGRLVPSPQNRFMGQNRGSYLNPSLDQLIDRLYATIDRREQGGLLKEMGEIIAADLPMLPTHWRVNSLAVVKGVRGPTQEEYAGSSQPGGDGLGYLSRNGHLWDRE